VIALATQIKEFPRHAREHLGIRYGSVEVAGIRQELRHMITDLRDTRLDRERRIPSPSIGAIEAVRLARLA